MELETFFLRLKFLRENFGWSQKEFGKMVGVSSNTVLSWERDTYPKGDSLLHIAELLKCSTDWLLTGEGEVGRDPQYYSDADIVISQHIGIVKQFKDREAAKLANMELLSIERMNRLAFREVISYIKGVSNGLKLAEQKLDYQEESCKQDDIGKTNDYTDRRISDGLRRVS